MLLDGGLEKGLCKHFARLFAHNPLVLSEDDLGQTSEGNRLFENINTSIWHSMRFKVPDVSHECFWRTEFRVMSTQD